MKSLKSFFSKIMGAFGWHAEKSFPLCVNGQPLAFPPSRRESVEDYLRSVVLKQRTLKVLALNPGKGRAVSISTPEELSASLQQGCMIHINDARRPLMIAR